MSTADRIGYLLGKYGDLFLKGVGVTLLLAVVGTGIGLLLGLGLALLRNLKPTPQDSKFKSILKIIAAGLARIYIEVFRGTPMMVQAIIIYFGGKMIGIPWTYLVCGLFVISINTTAYMAEIIRSGINGVDVGQTEASRSLGMSHLQTMAYVIFPQALKNAIPAIGNEFIVNIKDSSVLNVITVSELFMAAKIASSATYFYIESYLIIAAIYLVLTIVFSQLLKILEKKLNAPFVPKLRKVFHA
ncbi:MAG TPA: amino acid ABC transporter permease [Bacilli bacterium]|nr:amino acid ABC transporter permease [Bacilli bacterium]HPV69724.1 amino acid ABC transporter permease [Bacilli bacterium]